MNITINPINTIDNKNLAFQAKYYRIPIQKAAESEAKEVVSKAGASALAAAALIIPIVRNNKKVKEIQVPPKPTIDELAENIPRLYFDGELIFDPQNFEKKFDYEKFKKISEERNHRFLILDNKFDVRKRDRDRSFISPDARRIVIFPREWTWYTIQYNPKDNGLSYIEIQRAIAETGEHVPLMKTMIAYPDGTAGIKYRDGLAWGTSRYIEYIPIDNDEMVINIYKREHRGSSEPDTKQEEWLDTIINDDTMRDKYHSEYDKRIFAFYD